MKRRSRELKEKKKKHVGKLGGSNQKVKKTMAQFFGCFLEKGGMWNSTPQIYILKKKYY